MSKITLMSFGFKYGQPNANYYFDVGFIKNPARESNWGFESEVDEEMKRFVLEQPQAAAFIQTVMPLIVFLKDIDQHQVFAFGCSAGRHRSPVIVEVLASILQDSGTEVEVIHRERT